VWLRKHSDHYVATKKRLTHPITIIGNVLGGGALAVILLTFNDILGYTTGFIALAVIIFVKIGLNIWRNIVLVPD
jgi:hypothetical protein